MSESIFTLPDNRKVKLCKSVIEFMFSFAQDYPKDPESGGIIIGRILDYSSDLVVDDASEPMKSDIQSRYRFLRKSYGHQEFFDRHWEQSEGRCFYLGEWHTHPEATPTPSSIDLQGWRKLLEEHIQGQKQLLFVIVGTKSLVVWLGNSAHSEISITKLGSFNRSNIDIAR